MKRSSFTVVPAAVLSASLLSATAVRAGQNKVPQAPATSAVQKLRDGLYRVGTITVDIAKKELTVACSINSDVTTLEFVANTRGGNKAYESALTIDADAVSFNAALLLLGLDPSHARVPTRHFDPVAPKGDPLEISLDWQAADGPHHAPIERLLYDERSRATLAEGPWVYTGSTFIDGRYLAALDGVLIGFVHSPSPVIENPRPGAVDAYGSIVLNKDFVVARGAALTLTIKALPVKKR